MAEVNELVATVGVKVDEGSMKKVDEVQTKVKHLTDTFSKLGGIITSMGHSITGGQSFLNFFGGAIGRGQDIVNTARAIGMTTDALQEWRYAATASGVSADSVINDLESLHNNFFMSEKSVLSLADSFSKMSSEGAHWLGAQYGLSRDTILMLREGREAILARQKAAKEAGAITPQEELEKAAKMRREIDAQKEAFRKLADQAAYNFLPALNKILEIFNEWIGSDPTNVEKIVEGITGLLGLLAGVNIASGIKKAFDAISIFTGGLSGLKTVLIGSGLAAAVYGLYDSFQAWKRGEDTIIPWDSIIEDFQIAADRIGELIEGIKDKWNAFKEWLATEEGKKAIGMAEAGWEGVKEAAKGSYLVAKDLTNWAGAFGGGLITANPLIHPIDAVKNAFTLGNLSLQNSEAWKYAKSLEGQDNQLPSKAMTSVLFRKETGSAKTQPTSWDEIIGPQFSVQDMAKSKEVNIENVNIYTSEAMRELVNGLENMGTSINTNGFDLNGIL